MFNIKFMCGSRGGTGGPDPSPTDKSQKYRVSENGGPGLLRNHDAIKPAFNVGPLSARVSLAGR